LEASNISQDEITKNPQAVLDVLEFYTENIATTGLNTNRRGEAPMLDFQTDDDGATLIGTDSFASRMGNMSLGSLDTTYGSVMDSASNGTLRNDYGGRQQQYASNTSTLQRHQQQQQAYHQLQQQQQQQQQQFNSLQRPTSPPRFYSEPTTNDVGHSSSFSPSSPKQSSRTQTSQSPHHHHTHQQHITSPTSPNGNGASMGQLSQADAEREYERQMQLAMERKIERDRQIQAAHQEREREWNERERLKNLNAGGGTMSGASGDKAVGGMVGAKYAAQGPGLMTPAASPQVRGPWKLYPNWFFLSPLLSSFVEKGIGNRELTWYGFFFLFVLFSTTGLYLANKNLAKTGHPSVGDLLHALRTRTKKVVMHP
jgi:hypothetical protein